MKPPILIVVEQNGSLADETLRLVRAQGLSVRITQHLQEACELLSQRLDIVLLTAPAAAAAVRSALFQLKQPHPGILVVVSERNSKEALLELLEAGAFSFMRQPRTATSILKELHRIRRLLKTWAAPTRYPLRKAG
ncbi:MAG: hypothetical protein GXP25_24090 [Planctomycetes bacterium]|nr:hypothetical protein [Planctomycetota bacterium]